VRKREKKLLATAWITAINIHTRKKKSDRKSSGAEPTFLITQGWVKKKLKCFRAKGVSVQKVKGLGGR